MLKSTIVGMHVGILSFAAGVFTQEGKEIVIKVERTRSWAVNEWIEISPDAECRRTEIGLQCRSKDPDLTFVGVTNLGRFELPPPRESVKLARKE